MSSKPRKFVCLGIEELEQRNTPSGGNVIVQLIGGQYQIKGDSNPNAVILGRSGNGNILIQGGVSGGGMTTINGGRSVQIPSNQKVAISLGDGADRLTIGGSTNSRLLFNTLDLSLGAGLDTLSGQDVYVSNELKIDMGVDRTPSGYEQASLFSVDVGKLSYQTNRSAGANSFNLAESTVRGDISIQGSSGSDSVTVASTKILGSLFANLGNESNNVALTDIFLMVKSSVGHDVHVNLGDGRGVATFNSVTADTLDVCSGGYDNDQFVIHGSRIRRAYFDGGAGKRDSISGSGNVFSERLDIIRIEKDYLY